jgi:hypothetical protein
LIAIIDRKANSSTCAPTVIVFDASNLADANVRRVEVEV